MTNDPIVSKLLVFLVGWGLLTILLAFFIQSRDFYMGSPILRKRLDVQEAFQVGAAAAAAAAPPPFADRDEEAGGDVVPGNPELNRPTVPYNLLADWLPAATTPLHPGSQACHQVDFQARLERTGNYRQLTNNYKRGDPDSCSAPIQDMTLAFYKTTPVGF